MTPEEFDREHLADFGGGEVDSDGFDQDTTISQQSLVKFLRVLEKMYPLFFDCCIMQNLGNDEGFESSDACFWLKWVMIRLSVRYGNTVKGVAEEFAGFGPGDTDFTDYANRATTREVTRIGELVRRASAREPADRDARRIGNLTLMAHRSRRILVTFLRRRLHV